MISWEQAYKTVMSSARHTGVEKVTIEEAFGRVVAADIHADRDMPPFNKSAMDGFACRRADLADVLEVIETIPAGHKPQKRVGKGKCSRIMTGAMVPQGADCVIMVEDTKEISKNKIQFIADKTHDNICPKGEDIRDGEVLLKKGTLLGPEHIAILAAVGCAKPKVSVRPRVGIIATGDELVEPGKKCSLAQIRNSNGYQLLAQVKESGAVGKYYGIAQDNKKSIARLLSAATETSDVVVLSGGVSEGDFDLVREMMREKQIRILFERVAVKPGKPTVFGVSKKVFCFALPGNPVSSFVIFELLVKPFLYKMMRHDYEPPAFPMKLKTAVRRKKTDRKAWVPVKFVGSGEVEEVEYHGPAHSQALCVADGLIVMETGIAEIGKGTVVDVRPL